MILLWIDWSEKLFIFSKQEEENPNLIKADPQDDVDDSFITSQDIKPLILIEEKENDPETDFPIKTEEDAGLLDLKYKQGLFENDCLIRMEDFGNSECDS